MNIENVCNSKLGVKNGQFSPLAKKPNCVSTQTNNEAKKVQPLSYNGDAKEYIAKVAKVISSMNGADIKQQTDNYVYAVFTTKIMHFKDDVEIYLDDESKTLNFRSASRVGYSDLGVNKKRYDAFVDLLKA